MKQAFIAVLLIMATVNANAQFLFRISGNGLEQPSYMLGTIHTLHGSVLDHTPVYVETESLCKQFYTEFDITDQQLMNELNSDIEKTKSNLRLPEGKTILDILSNEQIETVDVRVKEIFGMNLSDPKMKSFWNFQPRVFTYFINRKIQGETIKKYGPQSSSRSALIDETCILRAKLFGMEIGHLDELEDRIKIQGFQSQGIEEQVDSLMDLVGNYDHHMQVAIKTAEVLKQSTVYWCLADYENFASMPYWQKTVKDSPSVFKERNEKWIPKMQKAMQKAPVMFNFGAGHLIGDYGIIQLLRNVGYNVEQVESK